MKTKIFFAISFLGIAAFSLAGCSNKATSPASAPSPEAPEPKIVNLSPHGMFVSSRCFLNRIVSEAEQSKRFSRASFVFLENGKARFEFENFVDPGCVVRMGVSVLKFDRVSVEKSGEASVMILEKPRTILNPRWYIPMTFTDQGTYVFDMDYLDRKAGPYVTEPDAFELEEARVTAAKQGVEFTRVE
jgi:hypothetical protein